MLKLNEEYKIQREADNRIQYQNIVENIDHSRRIHVMFYSTVIQYRHTSYHLKSKAEQQLKLLKPI